MLDAPAPVHIWFTPADCAALLDATRHGDAWRAVCPVHGGDNPQSLSISEGLGHYGHPATLLHCFAHQCAIEDICEAMGIHLRNLFCIHPDYARETRHQPRAHSPRVERLRRQPTPATSDEIAQILLEEMIVSDPEWIQTCAPARAKMWELAQNPAVKQAFMIALEQAHIVPRPFWETLRQECGGVHE